MAQDPNIPDLERITFFPGQRLTARDLTELQRAHRELRWLHNRSLHNWGIGVGLTVSGKRGSSAVTVETGYGIDCLGREIILTEPQTMPVPAVAGGPSGGEAVYYLIAAYQPNEDQPVAERRAGVCRPEGTVRLSETPRLEWRKPLQLEADREGMQLVLAQVWIQNCQLSRPPSFAPRRYARPAEQPYIAAGQTIPGKTDWRFWPDPDDPATASGVETVVDTSAARFRHTPRYQARVGGSRRLANDPLTAQIAAEYVYEELNARSAITINDGTADSQRLTTKFREIFGNLDGAEVLEAYTIDVNDTDFTTLLHEIAERGRLDVLYFPIFESHATFLAQQAAILMASISDFNITLIDKESVILLLEGFGRVVDITPDSFSFRLLLPRGLDTRDDAAQPGERVSIHRLNPEAVFVDNDAESLFMTQLKWHVVWMGIEG